MRACRTGFLGLLFVACRSVEAASDLPPDRPVADAGADAAALDASTPPGDAALDASDAAASPCGEGTLVRELTCPGAPLTPPAAFASALTGASPGDVVSLAGLVPDDAPCLPAVVCTPKDSATLLFSDSPESPTADGVLYADTLKAGAYRLYVYHANGSATARKFPVVVLNQGAVTANVTITRRGLAAPSTAYVSVGKTVLLDYFSTKAPVTVAVPAGQRVLLDADLDALHAAQNELVHAIYDLTVDAPVKVSFVSVLATADAAAATAGLSLLTRDADHQRGTFANADLLVSARTSQTGVQRLRLGSGDVDPTLTGTDATSPGNDAQTLLGNYGLMYRFALPAVPLALAPRGGGWGGVSGAIALPNSAEQLATTTDAIALSKSTTSLATAGGSNLPVDLLVVTP